MIFFVHQTDGNSRHIDPKCLHHAFIAGADFLTHPNIRVLLLCRIVYKQGSHWRCAFGPPKSLFVGLHNDVLYALSIQVLDHLSFFLHFVRQNLCSLVSIMMCSTALDPSIGPSLLLLPLRSSRCHHCATYPVLGVGVAQPPVATPPSTFAWRAFSNRLSPLARGRVPRRTRILLASLAPWVSSFSYSWIAKSLDQIALFQRTTQRAGNTAPPCLPSDKG